MSERSTRDGPAGDFSDRIVDPLQFIRQEHDRQYEICELLQDLPNHFDGGMDLGLVRSLQEFLRKDLPRHVDDEEIDLFPALSIRCRDHEGLDLILSQLEAEHELDLGLVEPISSELQTIIDTGVPGDPHRLSSNLWTFAETQRRHLLWENRVVLPLAEKYFDQTDREALAAKLAARRAGARSG